MNFVKLLSSVETIAREAGDVVLDVYRQVPQLDVEYKSDSSPVTAADRRADEVIRRGLGQISDLPIISEESELAPWSERKTWSDYWLVDPLDGTKEFIAKSDEFTVNIALISSGAPVLGVVYAPALDTLYKGAAGCGASKSVSTDEVATPIRVAELARGSRPWVILGSRSHQTPAFHSFVERFRDPEIVLRGSSLKLCLVAEGAADLYPRFGPTFEWDTAAGQAIIEAAGGRVIDSESGQDLRYSTQASLLNPCFVACATVSEWLYSDVLEKPSFDRPSSDE